MAACAHVHPTPAEAGPAFHLADGRPLSLQEVGALAARHRFVVVGEVHDSPCDHQAQVAVLDALVQAGTRPVVALESVAVDRQEALDRFSSGSLEPDALEGALDWEAAWGFPFELTEPLFSATRRHGLPLAALNLPRETIRQLGRNGLEGIAPSLREQLPRLIPPPPAQVEALREVWRGHGASARGFDRFVLVQSAWDSQWLITK